MKYKKLISNCKQRHLFNITEIKQKIFKLLFLYTIDNYFKLIITKQFYFKLIKNNFKSRIKNYCIISGRSRSINCKYKVSRINFRSLINEGVLFGLKKGTW